MRRCAGMLFCSRRTASIRARSASPPRASNSPRAGRAGPGEVAVDQHDRALDLRHPRQQHAGAAALVEEVEQLAGLHLGEIAGQHRAFRVQTADVREQPAAPIAQGQKKVRRRFEQLPCAAREAAAGVVGFQSPQHAPTRRADSSAARHSLSHPPLFRCHSSSSCAEKMRNSLFRGSVCWRPLKKSVGVARTPAAAPSFFCFSMIGSNRPA